MKKNKIQFDISVSNINENIYDLLRKSYQEKNLFSLNPNDSNSELLFDNLEKNFQYDLHKMIRLQYFDKEKFIDYYGNPDHNHYDYNYSKSQHDFYETGYSSKTLSDLNGNFYIIHPDELCICRNIIGDITGVDNKCHVKYNNGRIISYKINSFWDKLLERQFVVKNIKNSDFFLKQYSPPQ